MDAPTELREPAEAPGKEMAAQAKDENACAFPASEREARIEEQPAEQGISGRPLMQAAFSPAMLGMLLIGLAAAYMFSRQYHFLLEDCYISLRYARNLHDGFGPRFNPGEQPVEGYTNFSWMLLCSIHFFFTKHPESLLIYYNRAFGLLCILAVWWELLRRGEVGRQWMWLGAGLVALHQSMHSWMAGGLETHFFAFLLVVAVGRFLREEFTPVHAQRPWSALAMSLVLLTRPEGYLAGVICWAVMVGRRIFRVREAPDGWRRVLVWGGICAAVGGTHIIWRRFYYDDWLPNTFYAKVHGAYFEKGVPYVLLFLRSNYLHWGVMAGLGVIGLAAAILGRCAGLAGQILTLAMIVGPYFLYVMYAGGDVFEFRLLAPTIPLIALLVPMVLHAIVSAARRIKFGGVAPYFAAVVLTTCAGATLVLRLFYTATHHETYREELYTKLYVPAADYLQGWNFGESLQPVGHWLHAYGSPGERLATGAAGAMPYFSKLPTLDKLGLNDRYVSRMPLTARGYIGHERMAPDEYLAKSNVVYDVDNLDYQATPVPFDPVYTQNSRVLVVQLVDGRWMHFRTFVDAEKLRIELRKRGAIVWPGPNEDKAEVWKQNKGNWLAFEKTANSMSYKPRQYLPAQFQN